MNDEIEKRICGHLDRSLNEMQQDPELRESLASARQKALAQLSHKGRPISKAFPMSIAMPAGLSAIALAALVFIVLPGAFKSAQEAPMFMIELEVLTEGEDLDMLEEDLDFYLWAEAQSKV